jgi:hypothetical protein
LVYRRVVKDLDDNNKILDDTYTILYTPEHLTRKLCDDLHELDITLFYCDRPQYNVTDGADMATPGSSVRMGSAIKAEHDFGVVDGSLILVVAATSFRHHLYRRAAEKHTSV